MLNIVIKETDAFFRAGLQCFLEDFFFHNFKHLLHFDGELSHENVSAADIIFLSLCQGETLTCYPELQARKKGIVVGLVDDEHRFSTYPSCFQDMIFISRARRWTGSPRRCLSHGTAHSSQAFTGGREAAANASIKYYRHSKFALW